MLCYRTRQRTVLDQNREALLHQQGRIKDDQPEAQGKDIIASPDFQEISDSLLHMGPHAWSRTLSQHSPFLPMVQQLSNDWFGFPHLSGKRKKRKARLPLRVGVPSFQQGHANIRA